MNIITLFSLKKIIKIFTFCLSFSSSIAELDLSGYLMLSISKDSIILFLPFLAHNKDNQLLNTETAKGLILFLKYYINSKHIQ